MRGYGATDNNTTKRSKDLMNRHSQCSHTSATEDLSEDGYFLDPDLSVPTHTRTQLGADAMFQEGVTNGNQVLRRESFVAQFVYSKGPPQIVLLMILLSFGLGCTIGVIPAVMSDRYARLYHGYTGEVQCNDIAVQDKPDACFAGSADAQNAVAIEQFISNGLTFFTSSLVGSLSDEYGRKGILLIGLLLSCFSPLTLLLLQLDPTMSPNWYYAVGALQGLCNWIAISLSSLSDVMPPKWRAPSFGLLLAGFGLGFSVAPSLALLMGQLRVTILSVAVVWLGFFVVLCWLPETLPATSAARAAAVRAERMAHFETSWEQWRATLLRPLWELSILNRSRLFRLLSALAFFSGIVSSGNQSLLVYYIQERLGFDAKDIATMFLIVGLLVIVVQSTMLKFFNDCLGERRVVMLAFLLGVLHNLFYGLARTKKAIFVGAAISSFVSMSFPTISAIKSNNVDISEQGRIQGALYSLQALASALGPASMRFVYHYTKDGAFVGPGSMFVFSSLVYLIAVYFAYLLPPEANSKSSRDDQPCPPCGDDSTPEDPLIVDV